MAQQFYKIRAKTLNDACRKMRDTLGDEARVVNTASVKQGGVLGLFSRDAVEITVTVPARSAQRSASPAAKRYEAVAASTESAGDANSADKRRVLEHLLREAQQRMAGGAAPTAPSAGLSQEVDRAPVGARFSAVVDDETPPRQAVSGERVPSPVLPFPKRPPAQDADHQAMREELREMREMLQALYAEHPEAGLPPETAPCYRTLIERGLERKTAASLITRALKSSDPVLMRDPRIFKERLFFELRKAIPVTGGITLSMGVRRVVALCGATGVGKTTNVAKLAAQFALRRHARVALVTLDTYRVAAPEQLRVYANIMGLPMRVCNDADDVADAMKEFRGHDLIFIDTAGGSQFNLEQIRELQIMLRAASPDETILVMAANTPLADLRHVVANFSCLGPTSALFTKIDETRQYGGMTSLLLENKLPLSYLSVGQNVPDDIRTASPAQVAALLLEGKFSRE